MTDQGDGFKLAAAVSASIEDATVLSTGDPVVPNQAGHKNCVNGIGSQELKSFVTALIA
jgi:hypothetical protein